MIPPKAYSPLRSVVRQSKGVYSLTVLPASIRDHFPEKVGFLHSPPSSRRSAKPCSTPQALGNTSYVHPLGKSQVLRSSLVYSKKNSAGAPASRIPLQRIERRIALP